ncbi:unnamed protein product [Spirodela intermedia]|uniref:Growth-regulating factor n=1 Tax=Spirodela intermedia TaxID=51605 RepID=A0A7I8IF24_SPIIN|nr:unnamed protein product [Spirodela intermedia]CAA6656408.1 unnamed protein product [Spirodela intermedia]
MAGIPVPPDLLLPIRKGFDSMASRFFHHPSMGYCSYGKKLDPEPGRCRRTDGKKWRCSKDAYPDSKYCERHMHRGRNRSRKPVEAQTLAQSPSSSSSPSSTVTSLAPSGSLASGGSSGGGFRSCLPLHSIAAGAAASGGGNAAAAVAPVSFAGPSLNQLQMDLGCHGIGIGDHRSVLPPPLATELTRIVGEIFGSSSW